MTLRPEPNAPLISSHNLPFTTLVFWYRRVGRCGGDRDDIAGQGLDLSEFFESTEGCFTTPQVSNVNLTRNILACD